MKMQDMLAQQFGMMYQVAGLNLEGMTQEHSLKQPAPGGNCANWILGHLTDVQNGAMGLVGEDPVWDSKELSKASYDPITEPGRAIDWETMRSRFLGSRERCVAAIKNLADEKLVDPVPHPFGGQCSRAELLSLLSSHQMYHAGQLGIVRRIAGLEGKVKGPGQPKETGARAM
jgi:uncharacterized damage-inducible protein DinB